MEFLLELVLPWFGGIAYGCGLLMVVFDLLTPHEKPLYSDVNEEIAETVAIMLFRQTSILLLVLGTSFFCAWIFLKGGM